MQKPALLAHCRLISFLLQLGNSFLLVVEVGKRPDLHRDLVLSTKPPGHGSQGLLYVTLGVTYLKKAYLDCLKEIPQQQALQKCYEVSVLNFTQAIS